LLPSLSNPPGVESIVNLLEVMQSEEEFQIFTAQPLVDYIDYKWETYGCQIHYVGAAMHAFYMTTITAYNLMAYIQAERYGETTSPYLPFLMALGFLYPTIYESSCLWRTGAAYFKDAWNWNDILYTFAGWANIAFGASFPAHSL